jgi:hypothetical protein
MPAALLRRLDRTRPEPSWQDAGFVLTEVLADPTSDEHQDMLEWLGLDKATDFDPHRFDVDQANRMLAAVDAERGSR